MFRALIRELIHLSQFSSVPLLTPQGEGENRPRTEIAFRFKISFLENVFIFISSTCDKNFLCVYSEISSCLLSQK